MKRILIVEAEFDLAKGLQFNLEAGEFATHIAETGGGALQAIRVGCDSERSNRATPSGGFGSWRTSKKHGKVPRPRAFRPPSIIRCETALLREFRTRLIVCVVTGKSAGREAVSAVPEKPGIRGAVLDNTEGSTANRVERELR